MFSDERSHDALSLREKQNTGPLWSGGGGGGGGGGGDDPLD